MEAEPAQLNFRVIAEDLSDLIARQLPRWLSQACRDPNVLAYGCFDRNWWHYRIRDFASILLQQGGYAVHHAARVRPDVVSPRAADALAAAACRFWNARAVRHGAFEEYYPWEQGYPPLAFSTLAVAKLVHAGVVPCADVLPGFRVAARQLASRFEPKAANQQIAGLAALAWIRLVAPELVTPEALEKQAVLTLALQTDEGWFWEYDGPDIGYLSVALDCLWDLWDATQDTRFKDAAFRASGFIHLCTAALGGGLGMLNARNTDYVLPYGLARCVREGDATHRVEAAAALRVLFRDVASPHHFLHAVDDRYWCHYIGHSVARATVLLREQSVFADVPMPFPEELELPLCGYTFQRHADGLRLAVAGHKGGSLALRDSGGASAADYGWVVQIGVKQHVTHWWSQSWALSHEPDGSLTVSGRLVPTKELTSTPWMHGALRIASLCFGRILIGHLKGVMIFKRATSPCVFCRRIVFDAQCLTVQDEITGLPTGATVLRASRASKRHVASADSFHPEDDVLERGFECIAETAQSGATFRATLRWRKG